MNEIASKLSFKGGRVYLFGSCANNFGTVSSDVDVCLALPVSKEIDISSSEVVLVSISIYYLVQYSRMTLLVLLI